jgi:single-stranded DNA-binding protein
VNSVSLIGRVLGEPELRENRAGIDQCTMRLAVPRRGPGGAPEPGVVYITVTTFGREARECAERLSDGSRLGLSGRLEPEDGRHVLIDQLDFL